MVGWLFLFFCLNDPFLQNSTSRVRKKNSALLFGKYKEPNLFNCWGPFFLKKKSNNNSQDSLIFTLVRASYKDRNHDGESVSNELAA